MRLSSFFYRFNVRHKWRADETQVSVKNTLVVKNRLISEPQDIARPTSCHCYGWWAVYSSRSLLIIFWYWVLYFFASFLKKSTLALLSEIVTLTVSSLKANSAGDGRKSFITFTSPIGSSVYFIFPFIDSFSFPPISGAKDPDLGFPICKANSHDSVCDLP